ncbi:PREDICTED: tyrosine-protein kinase Abl-like [Branchiostoma belcheri]|uniref:Tyrosine-protein kinase Abl-like n=1 Tax=Branchiostoma belcheri TaxID=7741 RepID=A0A6P4Z025_BRABE|nr:PREDICTED: tyrosine-protein kinase Abl-like [Branchiostoma belcheri]
MGYKVQQSKNGIVLQDDGVTETIDGTSAELHWCYGFRPSKQVIFEAWWFKQTGGDQVLVASRYPARNASVQSRYKGRVEVFGDADLLLKAVSPADVGTYQLFAAFSDASDPLWKDRHLVVYYPPTNMAVTSSLSATEGDQVTILAHANSVPPPTYLWTKVNGSLPSDSVMNRTTGTFTLPHATLNDSGTYRVIATETPAAGGRSTPHVAMSTTETPAAGGRSIPRTVYSTRGGGRSNPHVVTAAVVPSVVLLVLAVVAAVLGYRWIRKRQSDKHPEEQLTEVHRPPLPLPPPVPARPQFLEYEVNPTDLQLKEQIGRGAFGVVFLASLKKVVDGFLTEQTVVVKTVHEDAGVEEIKNFIREVDTTINLRQHINLLGLVGCCTLSHPPYLVTEYMPYGDLKNFLLKCRKSDGALRDSMYDFKEKNVYQVAQQIANGMAYISQAGYVHGDLAARNVLVGEDLLVKIADFGLTTDIYERGYQRQDAEQRIPLRWMAPERLLREGRYTSKSDVWSFGVVLYEIATLGNVPYPGAERTVLMEELRSGYREPRPPGLKQDLYDMMLRCWQWEEDHRPEFHELYEELNAVVGSIAKDCEKPPSSSQEGQNEAADVAENLNDIPKLAPTTMQLHVTADVYNSESHEEIDSLTSSNEESGSEPVETKYINGYHSNNHIAVGFKVAQQNTLIESKDTDQSQMESSSPLGAAIMDSNDNSELPVSTNVQKNDRPMEGGYLPMASLPHYN